MRDQPRLVEVGFLVQNQTLYRYQNLKITDDNLDFPDQIRRNESPSPHLKHARVFGVPPLRSPLPIPGVEEAETDIAGFIQIRVDTYAERAVTNCRGLLGIVGRELNVEHEEAVVVGSSGGSDNGGPHEVDPLLVDPDEDGVRQVFLEFAPLLGDGLLEGAAWSEVFVRFLGVEE